LGFCITTESAAIGRISAAGEIKKYIYIYIYLKLWGLSEAVQQLPGPMQDQSIQVKIFSAVIIHQKAVKIQSTCVLN
jgi:hypothetical protein